MRVRSRSGFTLVELLIAMILLVMVSAAFWSAMSGVQRSTRTQTEMAAMRGTLRGGLQIVASDLQELYTNPALPAESDIVSMTSTLLRYRATRGSGVVCSATGIEIRILSDPDALWRGLHPPSTADAGLMIFHDGDPAVDDDDEWLTVPITGPVNPGSSCGGLPAWAVTVNVTEPDLTKLTTGVLLPAAPVRTYELMELGLMTENGRDWLGLRSVSGGDAALVPLAGPLQTGGVEFKYYLNGTTEAVLTSDVKMITLQLIGETDRRVNTGVSSTVDFVRDTMMLRMELRNSR